MKKIIWLACLTMLLSQVAMAQCQSGDCKNGVGVYLYPSGAKYIGNFTGGEIHGVGVCYYTNGSNYRGEWVFRYPEGKGTMTFPDGSKWTGVWKRGHPIDDSGNLMEDLFTRKNAEIDVNNIQTGCIAGDCKDGLGIFAYADGSKYDGTFADGHPDGQGTFFFADGEKYSGAFKNGYFHGTGTFYHSDGDVTTGKWEEGEYVGKPVSDPAREGCIAGNCDNGTGTYVFKGGSAKYVGTFKNRQPHGKGTVHYANGEKYEGEWAEGSFNGYGTLTLQDKTEVTGYWKNGTFMADQKLENTAVVDSATPAENEPETTDTDLASKSVEKPTQPAPVDDNEMPTSEEPVLVETKTEIDRARSVGNLKVWAVVVGVADYNHMPALRYTDDDAYRFLIFLKSPEGGALTDDQVQVLINEDATKQNIENAMRDVFAKAGPNDLVMLYFSGHGLKGSFLPIDFDGYNNKLYHEEVNAIFDESQAKYKLCIADACHSGSLLTMKSGEVSNTLETYYKTLAQATPGTALLMSSKSDETSLESSGLRQGVFSHFLIRGLKGEADANADKIVTIQELFSFIDKNVREYTGDRQTPLIKGDYDFNMTVSVVR
jgi:hypothetical protein